MIIALSIFCFVQLLFLIVVCVTCFFALRANFTLQRQNEIYKDFLEEVTSVLESDIDLFKLQLARKLSMEIPEVHELNLSLNRLRDDITKVKTAAKAVSREVDSQ